MESVSPFSERMRWIVARSGGVEHDSLVIDRREAAFVMSCPTGWAARQNWLPFHAPGAHEVYRTRVLAMKAAEDWFKGLDIVPWD
jgi:hypothetical protein